MKRERHPYGEFIPKGATALIIGSFPIGKFTDPHRKKEIRAHEFDFFFGGEKNLLWKLLADVYDVSLKSRIDIEFFLKKRKLGVADVIKSCRRIKGGASDSALYDIQWNTELEKHIRKHHISKVYFTGKKVEQWFNRLFPEMHVEKVTLIFPSAQSVRSLPRHPEFVTWKKHNPGGRAYEFILQSYRNKFRP